MELTQRYQNVGRRPGLVQSFRESINVKAWGAVGDAVTNDAPAIQAAINAAATPNNVIYFPAGRYVINTGLTVTQAFTTTLLFADGARLLAGANDLTLVAFDTDSATAAFLGPGIVGADLRGNGFTGIIGVQFADGWNYRLEDVSIFACNIGVRCTTITGPAGAGGQFCEGLYFKRLFIDRPTDTGIRFSQGTGDPGFAESHFEDVFINLPTNTGIDVVESAAGGIRLGRSKWFNILVWIGDEAGAGNTRRAYRFAGDTSGVLNDSTLHLAAEVSNESANPPTGSIYPIELHADADVDSCKFVLSTSGTWTANVLNPGNKVIHIEREPNIVQRWAGSAQNILEIQDTNATQRAGLRMTGGNQFVIWSDNEVIFFDDDLVTMADVQFRTIDGRGGIRTNLRTLTAGATLAITDHNIIADATTAAFTITLTDIGLTNGAGTMFQIKRVNAGANNVTIDGFGAQTIDGALTYVLTYQYQAVTLVNDGANWFAVEGFPVFGAVGGAIDIGDTASDGTATTVARSDHQHQFSAPGAGYPIDADFSAEADGTATTPARSDHRHTLTAPGAGYPVDTDFNAEADGTATTPARSDHRHSIPAPGVGYPVDTSFTAESDGTATTPARSDHRHTLTVPAAPANVTKAAAAAGTALPAAREDHKHDITTAAPSNVTKAAAVEGVATSLARSDHKHDITTAAAGASALADTAAEGTATSLARSDHRHSRESHNFEKAATLLDPVAVNAIAWRAPYACTVTKVYGYRVGGTGATINARLNGASNHLAADLSLTSVDTWMDAGAVQNTAYVAGDKLEVMVVSVTGAPTQVSIQVEFSRP